MVYFSLNILVGTSNAPIIFLVQIDPFKAYVTRCAIWYHLRNLTNVENTQEGVLLLVKLQTFILKLYKTLLHRFFHVF